MRRLYSFLLTTALVAVGLPAAAQVLIATVPVGVRPVYLAGNPTNNTIYVLNVCGNDPQCGSESPGTVTVIDGATNTVTATITVGLQSSFFVINPITNKIYVTNFADNTVSVINGATNTVTTTITGFMSPFGADVNTGTNKIYIVNVGANTVSEIDGTTDTVVGTVQVGNMPHQVAVNSSTDKIYVGDYCGADPNCLTDGGAAGTVTVIDGVTNDTTTVMVGVGPANVVADLVTNKVAVQNICGNTPSCIASGNQNTPGTATLIDGVTLATSTVSTGNGSASLAVNSVTNQVYVTNHTDNTATFIDEATLATTTVNVGTGPDDVEVDPVTYKIYVVDNVADNVTTIDGATLATTTVGVGLGPVEAWVNPVTNRVYVSNLGDSGDGTVSILAGARMVTTTTLTSAPNPSNYLQQVTLTATVTASNGGSPTGTASFAADGTIICPNIQLVPGRNGSTADCATSSLAVGSHNVQACYSGDGNFAPGCGTLTQMVLVSGDFNVLVTPGSATVNNDPFFAQTINVTVQPLNGYDNIVMLSCSVNPPLTSGSCVVNPPTSGLVDANLVTALTITAGSGTPIGCYTVTVTGQDQNGLMHQASQNLTVIQNGPGISMPPGGGGGPILVNFACSSRNPITPSCPLVNGTGLNGNQPLSMIGGVCTFSPPNGPGPFMLVISGCQVARLRTHRPIYATFFLGLPGLVLLGSLAGGRSRLRKVLQIIGLLMLVSAILWAVGCGGYGQLTPTGNYQVLVQGTGPDGTVYSAVVPVTVTPLH
jgi:YVTN family beta-propeller protein